LFYKEKKSCINLDWIQKYRPKKIFQRKKKIKEFIIDETLIKIGSELIWLWVAAIELGSKEFLGISISKEKYAPS
jgi:putative transposase